MIQSTYLQNRNRLTDLENKGMVTKEEKMRGGGSSRLAQWLTNPTKNHEVACWIPGLAQWVKDLALR